MSDLAYLILGTSSMVLMMVSIILFVSIYQRKLKSKELAYREIEKMMQKQELYSAYTLIEGQEQERKRIAADLHDNVGNLLATLKMYSDLVMVNENPKEVRRLNVKLNAVAENLAVEIRKLSHALDLSTLSGFGLKVAVEHLCEAIHESGKLNVTYLIDIPLPLKEETSLNVYRIIQELFTNTLKHAFASEVRLEITFISGEISLIYEDNGNGFEVNTLPNSGMGMRSIKSRVEHLNGELTIESSPKGTTIIVETREYE